ncbi:MAG: ABC transporter ATP-binding protein [Chloroflexi bacterium]|uniref:ABC transporter ATP-binding protein n=1 Tax=Candidatus Chlorohelix allophototropha TaxID=3003348 RepID=A0A8T7M429_9CHLR|nr:ABC transporter ATP-binding protein [Chloroflexota bacterium]WJW70189.1 ABC transporter ATP-binding protein [Chloroflexota bacterium L227-S17]
MDPQNVIEIVGLKKCYTRKEGNSGLKDLLVRLRGRTKTEEYWALQGIDLTVKRGATLGIIGNNGAGKSTLLRMICGLGRPTKGSVKRRGNLASLLELGSGFSPEFTGRENVMTILMLSGLTRKDALKRLPEIVEFSEISDFIDVPVRTYSSGMWLRLAFSAAICIDPDLIVVDEVLAVGDLRFKKKCLERMLKMKETGKTIILVSHSMDQIETLCDQVLWLENGRIREHGRSAEVVESYKNRAFTATVAPEKVAVVGSGPVAQFREGVSEIELKRVWLSNEQRQPIDAISPSDPLNVHIEYSPNGLIAEPNFLVGLYREDGIKLYETSTEADNVSVGDIATDGSITLTFSELPLLEGHYYLDVGIFEQNWNRSYVYTSRISAFHVIGHTPGKGVFQPPHRWEANKGDER